MAPFGVAPAPSVLRQPTDADVVDTEARAPPRAPQEYSLRAGNLVDNLDSSRHEARRRAREAKQQQEAEAMAAEQKAEERKKRTPTPPTPTSSDSSTSCASNHDEGADKADLLAIRF